jgi:hypothetical protein
MDGPDTAVDADTQPIDLMGYYLTASMGIGQAMRIPTIQKRLARYPVAPTLHCLAEIAMRADQLPIRDTQRAVEFARWVFPPGVAAQAAPRLGQPEASPISSQVAVNLALHALACCPPEGKTPPRGDLIRELGSLILALGDHLGRDRGDPDSFALEITRLGLFHSLNDLTTWLDLSGLLFMEVMPTMTDDHDFVDAQDVIASAYGLDLERFWALTVVEGVAARGADALATLPIRVEGWNVSDEELSAWQRAWSQPLRDAKAAAARDVGRGTGWSFEAFVDAPLTELDEIGCVSVRPAWMAAKATPSGLFWAVRHPYVANGGEHQRWSQFYGRAIERLGRRLLSELLPTVEVVSEDEISEWGPGANCDALLVGDAVVAIDFVFRQFTRETSGTGDFQHLAEDLRKAAVGKLLQIDGTLNKGLSNGYIDPAAIFPLVVVGGPFPVNPLLYETVERLVLENSPQVIGVEPRCRPVAMVDLASFLVMLRTAHELQCPIDELLEGWLSSGLARMSFREWLTTDGPGPHQPGDGPDWGPRAFTLLGLPAE